MPWAATPEGYKSPGFVIVSILEKEGKPPVVNVYGMHSSRAEAEKEKRRMIRETKEHERTDELPGWTLYVRTVHDIPQMNRLLDERDG